jgi:hypothetical protein
MAQISRPFQIALAAVVLLGGVWLFALKGHSSTSSSSSSAPPPSASAPASHPSSSAASSASGSGPTAPGVAGLTRAIEKAHGAVATSQQNAQQLQQKSQQASSNAAQGTGGTSAPSTHAGSGAAAVTSAASSSSASVTVHKTSSSASAAKPAAHGAPTKQHVVEAELNAGDVVVLLFWDAKGSDDRAVHSVVEGLAGFKVAVHVSPPRQVALYGAVTRGVQIYSTPTTLVIGKGGKARTLTGLTDEYALRQAISEARKEARKEAPKG